MPRSGSSTPMPWPQPRDQRRTSSPCHATACAHISEDCQRRPATMSCLKGELVTETFDYDGGRQITVYLPPDQPEAIVFAGDGQLIAPWGGGLEAAGVPPTM